MNLTIVDSIQGVLARATQDITGIVNAATTEVKGKAAKISLLTEIAVQSNEVRAKMLYDIIKDIS